MNKIIKDFEKLSGIDVYGLGRDRAKWEHCVEKFAYLIVKECAATTDNYTAMKVPPAMLGSLIKKQFGLD